MEQLGFFEQLSQSSQGAYSLLMNIGYLEDTFEWLGRSFTIRTLKLEEEFAIGQIIKHLNDTIMIEKAAVTAVVAACLVSVDGRPIILPVEKDLTASLREKYNLIAKHWHWPVIQRVNMKYLDLQQRMAEVLEEMENLSETDRMKNSESFTEQFDPLSVPVLSEESLQTD